MGSICWQCREVADPGEVAGGEGMGIRRFGNIGSAQL